MEENKSGKTTTEDKMMQAMSMSIFGQHLQSRCRVLTPGQRADLEESAIQGIMQNYQIDREKAEAMYRRSKG